MGKKLIVLLFLKTNHTQLLTVEKISQFKDGQLTLKRINRNPMMCILNLIIPTKLNLNYMNECCYSIIMMIRRNFVSIILSKYQNFYLIYNIINIFFFFF